MEDHGGSVLSHDPGVGVANFLNGISGEAGQFRIPRGSDHVMPAHAFAQLHKRVLDVARMLAVVQIFADLLIRELPSNQVLHQNKNGINTISHAIGREEQTIARGHPMTPGVPEAVRNFQQRFRRDQRLGDGSVEWPC